MKVLIDESLPQKLRFWIPGHEVVTVRHLRLQGMKNGELIRHAEGIGVEVLVTGDQNLYYQQNMAERRIALVMVSTNHWPLLKQHLSAIAAGVDAAMPSSFHEIECGHFR